MIFSASFQHSSETFVIPAKAGIHFEVSRNDELEIKRHSGLSGIVVAFRRFNSNTIPDKPE
jgi:hypothetical protein